MLSSLDVSVFAESSKELEELRGAFSRSLDYMKQDVEESRWTRVWQRFMVLMLLVGFSSRSLCCVMSGFGESGDPSCLIMQIWARIEVSGDVMSTFCASEAKGIVLIKIHSVLWLQTKENCYSLSSRESFCTLFSSPPPMLGPPL